MDATLKNYLAGCIEDKIFPGCAVGVVTRGQRSIVTAGKITYDDSAPKVTEETVYDVASITKAVPTSCLALKLMEEGRIGLRSRMTDYVPEFEGPFREQVQIEHLLTHTLDFDFRLSDKKNLPSQEILRAVFSARLRTPPGATYCYANATSILLGLVVERVFGQRLDKAAHRCFFGPLEMNHTTFFPEKPDRPSIAPTELDPWRNRVICGEVHDESAWALRPTVVAGSAGLFSTVSDLLIFLAMLLTGGNAYGRRVFRPETIRLMSSNALPYLPGVSTALGWELDQAAFMGSYRTASTFGKTGFTGCAMVGVVDTIGSEKQLRVAGEKDVRLQLTDNPHHFTA